MYLYLLKLADKKHFKIGISKEWYRMRKVHHAYEIDIKNSLSYWGKEADIRKYEKDIKRFTTAFKVSSFVKNGKTEIRTIDCLKKVLDYLGENGVVMKLISETPNSEKLQKPRKPRTVIAKATTIPNKVVTNTKRRV